MIMIMVKNIVIMIMMKKIKIMARMMKIIVMTRMMKIIMKKRKHVMVIIVTISKKMFEDEKRELTSV